MSKRWVRQVGDGAVVQGPCLLHSIIMFPDADSDYTDIYDGRDAVSGKKFCRIEAATSTSIVLDFGDGVPFDAGVYVDAEDSAVETTVIFTPL